MSPMRWSVRALAGAAVLAAFLTAVPVAGAAEQALKLPAPAVDPPPAAGGMQTAVFAGGCFWGVQGVFEHVRGVTQALSGYAGGPAKDASYELVSTGETGHAESVKVTYDPAVVSYGTLLRVFLSVIHDPTQVGGEGPDRGSQYRSEIFYVSPEQKRVAEAYIAQLTAAHSFAHPITTRVAPLHGFYPAEAYHQDFMTHHPDNPYIVWNDVPKLLALKRLFPSLYRPNPVLTGYAS
jgi:peptide-methionine (S)-S-oxide reductase